MSGLEIAEYDEFRAKLKEVEEACNFIPDVSTAEGHAKSKRVSLDVGKILTALEKARTEKKAHTLELGRSIDSDAKKIASELEVLQLPHKNAYKEYDNSKKEREAQRKKGLEERVDIMRNLPELMRDSDSDGVRAALEDVQNNECLDFYEYTEQALKARNSSIDALSVMFSDKLKYEKEQVELVRLRKEEEARKIKEREEQVAREAAESARREAEEAAEKLRLEAERKANAEKEKAEQERLEAERKATAEAEQAEQARLAVEAEKEAAEKATVAAEKRLKDQEAKAKQEQEQAVIRERQRLEAQAESEKQEAIERESNKQHKKKINNEALKCLVEGGLSEKDAKLAITLIAGKKVENVQIFY